MFFDRRKFFDSYRTKFGKLSPLQVNGLSQLLNFIEADSHIAKIPYAAYILATVKREAAGTYHPIHEYGGKAYFVKRYGGQTKKGKELGNDTPDEGYFYAGKGYPQTTGEANYEKAEKAIRKEYPEIVADFEKRTGKMFDLTVGDQPNDESDPANMMDPAIAYATMSYGMRKGMFTGHKFSDHLDEIPPNYKQARRIINGTDHWTEIETDAKKFEKILNESTATLTATDKQSESLIKGNSETADTLEGLPPSTETKTTEIVQTGATTTAVEQTVPGGDAPDVAPTLVSKNGPLSKWLASGGLAGLGAFIWTYIQSNPSAVAIAIICVTALIVAIIFRGAITDAVRMTAAADPTKKNVS